MSTETIVELSEFPTEHTVEPNSEPEPNCDIESSFEPLPTTDQSLPEQAGDTLPEPILDSSTVPSTVESIFESANESTAESGTELAFDTHSANSTAHPSTRAATPETLLERDIDTPQCSPLIHQTEDDPPPEFAFEEQEAFGETEPELTFIEPESDPESLEKGPEVQEAIESVENTDCDPNPEPSNLESEGDRLETASEPISFETAQEAYTDSIDAEEIEQGEREIDTAQDTSHTEFDGQSPHELVEDSEQGFEAQIVHDIERQGEEIVLPESTTETESHHFEELRDSHIPLESEFLPEEEELEASTLDYFQKTELAPQEEVVLDQPILDTEEELLQTPQSEQGIVLISKEEREFDQPSSDVSLENSQSFQSDQDTRSAFEERSVDQVGISEEQVDNSTSPEPEQDIAQISNENVSEHPVPGQGPGQHSKQNFPEEETYQFEAGFSSVRSEVDPSLEEQAQVNSDPEITEVIPDQDTDSQDLYLEPEPESSIVVVQETHLDTSKTTEQESRSISGSEAYQEDLDISFRPTITEEDQQDLEPIPVDTESRPDLSQAEEASQEGSPNDTHTDEIKDIGEDFDNVSSSEPDFPIVDSDSIPEFRQQSAILESATYQFEEELNSGQVYTAPNTYLEQPMEESHLATELHAPIESETSIKEQRPAIETQSAAVYNPEPSPDPIIDITPNNSKMALQERSSIASQLSDALALFTSFDDAVKTLVTRLQSTENNIVGNPSDGEHAEQTPSAPFNVPYARNQRFHGRFSILSRLFGMWRPQQRCRIVVAGLGGIGKTELLVEFIYRARQVSPTTPIFWFGPNDIRLKDASISTNPGMQLEDWMRGGHPRGSLLVIDVGDRSDLFGNASDHGPLIDQLRAFEGTVIMITRNARHGAAIARPHEICEVKELEIEACANLLCDNLESYTHDTSTEREIQDVVKSLFCFPRAIIQVAKLLNSTEMTIIQFLEMFSTSEDFKFRLLGRIPSYSQPDHDLSIFGRGVFDLRSFRRGYADQSRLLYQLYFLGGTSVPCVLVSIDDPLNKLLLMLIIKAHFMITEDVVNQTFTIHPLVYLAMRKALGSERSLSDEHDMLEERKWYDEVVLAFSKHYPDANCENRVWWKDCFTHLITGYNLHSDAVRIAIARIYHRESSFFKRKGIFSEALNMASLAKSVLPDPVPSECLVIVQDQVTLLDFLAKYREVHEMLRGLSMEVGHPGALWKKSMLAKLEVADCANRYDSAIDMFRQVRTAGEANNVDKLDLANATDDLGMALMQKGKYKEAASECKKALSERSSRLGSSHTDTLSSCHNMAEILMNDGKYEEALRYIQEALRGRENVLGLDHPETLHSRVLRARIQISKATTTAEFDEAEAVLIHAMDKLSVKLSPGHPIVMTCKSEIARIMFARGKYETAEQMNQAVLTAREQGPWLEPTTHPDTMTSRNQLAEVIRLKDGSKAAENLSERCLTERTVVLTNGTLSGDDFHPDQLASLHARAVVLSGLGQHLAALQKIDLALLGRKAILGEHHPDYFVSMTWKGEIMRAQLHRYQSERTQTLDTIENLHKQAYEGLSWILGSEHQRSLQAATHMALAKRERGGPASSEAEGLFRQIHCAFQHNMGDFHIETLKAKGRLAEAMRAASPRHHLEAKKLWRDSCGGLTRAYGFDAHVTANAYKGYEKFLKTYPDP